MDLLIQLLVWLFRTLFGEVDKPPDSTRRQFPVPPPQRRVQRGPYQYGDEPPGQAKTLEEILEEVRQAAALKRSQTGAPLPTQPRPTVPPVPSGPQPRPAAGAAQRAGARGPPPVARPAEAKVAPPAPEGLVSLKVTVPSLSDSLAVQPQAPEPMSVTGAAAGAEPLAAVSGVSGVSTVAEMSTVAEIMSPADAAAELAKGAAARAAKMPTGIAGFLNAILQAAPEQKRDVARQAIVLHEVFGPPRCRRPHRTGCRAF